MRLKRYDRNATSATSCALTMPNPTPVQSELFKQKRFQRTVDVHSSIPADVPLAQKAIAVKLPEKVDEAIRELGKQKAAWPR